MVQSRVAPHNVVECIRGDSNSGFMSVCVPREGSNRNNAGSEKFLSIVEKARSDSRSYLRGGDLSWYGRRDRHDGKLGRRMNHNCAASVKRNDTAANSDEKIWNLLRQSQLCMSTPRENPMATRDT